jgi:hypothetical protein
VDTLSVPKPLQAVDQGRQSNAVKLLLVVGDPDEAAVLAYALSLDSAVNPDQLIDTLARLRPTAAV